MRKLVRACVRACVRGVEWTADAVGLLGIAPSCGCDFDCCQGGAVDLRAVARPGHHKGPVTWVLPMGRERLTVVRPLTGSTDEHAEVALIGSTQAAAAVAV
jgi:hypothetical protein